MVIFCEECGGKYILPQSLSDIPAEFECPKCHDIFNIQQSVLKSIQNEQMDEQKTDDKGE
jgi:DNA-directed RNA polymerase subunit M/transcription elongation factor TFIIS